MISLVVAGVGCQDPPPARGRLGRVAQPDVTVETASGAAPQAATTSVAAREVSVREPSPLRPAQREDDREEHPRIVHITFDVLRARVPAGVFSGSEKVWSQLDTSSIPAESAAMLQPNGLRAARGRHSAWPAIKQIIEKEEKVEIAQNGMPVRNGVPLIIEADVKPRDQTLFLVRQGGQLAGASFPKSTNVIHVEYGIPVTNAKAVMMEVYPEILLHGVPVRPRLTLNGWVEGPSELPRRSLRELMVRIEIGPDEFLALGPSEAAHQPYLPGALLLCEEMDGKVWESMYFITPKVVSSVGAAGP